MAAEAPLPTAVQPGAAIATVGSVARALVGAGNLAELAEHALAAMCEALGLRIAALYLPEAADVPILRRFAVSGADVDAIGLLDELRFEQEAWRLASAGGRALVFHEPATWLVANPFDPPASAWLVLPLDAGGEVLGVVAAAQRHPLALEETSATVLAILGDLLGAGIAAARLRQRIARTEVERERLRLAADIHDGLAQDLALAKREIALLDSEPAPEQRARAARACARRWAPRTASSAPGSRTSPPACRSAACTTPSWRPASAPASAGCPSSCAPPRRSSRPSPKQPRSSCASSARRWPTSSATPRPVTSS